MLVMFSWRSERSATSLTAKMLLPFSAGVATDARETAPDVGMEMGRPATSIEFVTKGRLKVTSWRVGSKRILISLPSASCSLWKLASPLSRVAAELEICSLSGFGVWTA